MTKILWVIQSDNGGVHWHGGNKPEDELIDWLNTNGMAAPYRAVQFVEISELEKLKAVLESIDSYLHVNPTNRIDSGDYLHHQISEALTGNAAKTPQSI